METITFGGCDHTSLEEEKGKVQRCKREVIRSEREREREREIGRERKIKRERARGVMHPTPVIRLPTRTLYTVAK